MEAFITSVIVAVLSVTMSSFVIMLALGNFGFAQFGFTDCIPAGVILNALIGISPSGD